MVIMCLQHYLLCRESPGSPSGLVVCQKDLQDSAYSHIHGSDLLQKGYKTNPPKKGLWAMSRGNSVFRCKFSTVLNQWSHTGCVNSSALNCDSTCELLSPKEAYWRLLKLVLVFPELHSMHLFPLLILLYPFAIINQSPEDDHMLSPMSSIQTWGGLGDLQHTSQGPSLQADLSKILRIAVLLCPVYCPWHNIFKVYSCCGMCQVHSSSLNSIPLYVYMYNTSCSSIHLLVDTAIVTFWLL